MWKGPGLTALPRILTSLPTSEIFRLSSRHRSWGCIPQQSNLVWTPSWSGEVVGRIGHISLPLLAYGRGRSYGDQCLNTSGALVDTRFLSGIKSFDRQRGLLVCESGVTLADVLNLVVPHGWFVPVLPGTSTVTIGGAIANDIHGKNHHQVGTFSSCLRRLTLLRRDGLVHDLTPEDALFAATVAGMGLTGIILDATLQLVRQEPWVHVEYQRFQSIDGFFKIDETSQDWDLCVAWVDSLAKGRSLGRGIYMRGRHCSNPGSHASLNRMTIPIPGYAPNWLLNRHAMRAFNWLFYHKQLRDSVAATCHYRDFYFPLDWVGDWNLMYGPRGLLQYQCVVGPEQADAVVQIIEAVANAKMGSFLGVLKRFGSPRSPGMLSFPKPGYTVAFDFPDVGNDVRLLVRRLDSIVCEHGGRVYPAKDLLMDRDVFRHGYERLDEFRSHLDPGLLSDLWVRLGK